MLQRVAIVISEKNSELPFDEFAADSARKRPSSVKDVIAIGAQRNILTSVRC